MCDFENFTLTIEHHNTGLWLVTSSEIKGLLVAKGSRQEAIGWAAIAVEDHIEARHAVVQHQPPPPLDVRGVTKHGGFRW